MKNKKYIIFSILILLILIFSFSIKEKNKKLEQENIITNSAYFKEYMSHKKKLDNLKNNHSYKIIMLGDSLTAGNNWNNSFQTKYILNMGQGGDYTELNLTHYSLGLINRIDGLDTKYKKAFLMIGINDFIGNKEVNSVFSSYKKIIKKIQEKHIKIFIQSTLYIRKNKYNFDYKTINKKVSLLNQLLIDYCNKNEIPFINLNSILSQDRKLKKQFTYDGIHLNKDGYKEWIKTIKKYILKDNNA